MLKEGQHHPLQDRYVAKLWLDEAIKEAKGLTYPSGTVAYAIFTERMIKNKFRIQEWHLEYIGEKFNFKPMWAMLKFKNLLPQHK